MKCSQCGGTGRVIIDDTGLGWYLKEGQCPNCRGLGEVTAPKKTSVIFTVILFLVAILALIVLFHYALAG